MCVRVSTSSPTHPFQHFVPCTYFSGGRQYFFFLVSVCICMLYRGKERKRKETSQSPSAIFLVYFGLPATSPILSLPSFPFSPHTKGRTAFSYCTCVCLCECVLCLSHRVRRGSSSPLSATMHLPTM